MKPTTLLATLISLLLGAAIATLPPTTTRAADPNPGWIQLAPAASPSVRSQHAMAYDSARDRIILFGGHDPSGGYLSDTWEWDSATWTQRFPDTVPPGLHGHAMVYDAARERAVLFGGSTFLREEGRMASLAETWEWDGDDWSKRQPNVSPPARAEHAMAYDSLRERVVLFGGREDEPSVSADTWEWDGDSWNRHQPEASPRTGEPWVMAYDSERRRVVIYGNSPTAATWEWDGVTWMQFRPATIPPVRSWPAMVYDAYRSRVVLFGGYEGDGNAGRSLTDTWEWDGAVWHQMDPGTGPSGRGGSAMAYDTTRSRAVLFGGYGGWRGGELTADTWEYGVVKAPPQRAVYLPSAFAVGDY